MYIGRMQAAVRRPVLRLFRLRAEHGQSVRTELLLGRGGRRGSVARTVRSPGHEHAAVRPQPGHGGVRQTGRGRVAVVQVAEAAQPATVRGRRAAGAPGVRRPVRLVRFPVAAVRRPVQQRRTHRPGQVSRDGRPRRDGRRGPVPARPDAVPAVPDRLAAGRHRRHGTHRAVRPYTGRRPGIRGQGGEVLVIDPASTASPRARCR